MNIPARIQQTAVIFARVILGVVLIYASLDKISHPADFASAIGNYRVIPFGLENLLAIILPWLEMLTGLGLIFGFMLDGAAWLAMIMMAIFVAAISQALLRGIDIECGCFKVSESTGDKLGWRRLVEDGIYFILALLITLRREKRLELYPKSV